MIADVSIRGFPNEGVMLMRIGTIHLKRLLKEGVPRCFLFLLLTGCMACAVVLQSCAPSQRETSVEAPDAAEEPVYSDGLPAVNAADVDVDYPVNDYGETYGEMGDAPDRVWGTYEEVVGIYPDLIRAEATNGASGYVRKEDLFGPLLESPEDAIWSQVEKAKKGTPPLIVYDVDGRTAIGEFTIG